MSCYEKFNSGKDFFAAASVGMQVVCLRRMSYFCEPGDVGTIADVLENSDLVRIKWENQFQNTDGTCHWDWFSANAHLALMTKAIDEWEGNLELL